MFVSRDNNTAKVLASVFKLPKSSDSVALNFCPGGFKILIKPAGENFLVNIFLGRAAFEKFEPCPADEPVCAINLPRVFTELFQTKGSIELEKREDYLRIECAGNSRTSEINLHLRNADGQNENVDLVNPVFSHVLTISPAELYTCCNYFKPRSNTTFNIRDGYLYITDEDTEIKIDYPVESEGDNLPPYKQIFKIDAFRDFLKAISPISKRMTLKLEPENILSEYLCLHISLIAHNNYIFKLLDAECEIDTQTPSAANFYLAPVICIDRF